MKKGITLVTLLVILIVMIILATTVVVSGANAMNNAKKIKFASELLFMQETIQDYMRTHESNLPIKGSLVINENLPEGEYYEIDMALLGLVETTYGNKLNSDEKDIYVVSKNSKEIYYLKGLKIGNNIYYNLTDDLKEAINYTDTNIVSKDGIIFTPSETNYTNSEIIVNVQVPTEYSNVTVVSGNTEITEFVTEGKYNVYSITSASNFDIVVTYTKDGIQSKQTYTISNFDNVEPTIEIKEKIKIASEDEEKTSITITTNDNLSGVDKVLYVDDKVDKTYFETDNKAKQVTNNNVIVDRFTQYVTFYVVDMAGNSKILVETLNPTATEDDYAKYGLILHYDAINNTGNGHSSTTTVWKDLSGNGNNGTLTNFNNTASSGWSDNYLLFDGVNDYTSVLKTKTIDELLENGSVTVEMTFKYVTSPSGFRFLIDLKREAGNVGKALWIGNNGNNNFTVDARPGRFGLATSYNIEVAKFYNIVVAYGYNGSSTDEYFKINDKVVINRVIETNEKLLNNTAKSICIGGENATMNTNMKLYSMRIYNRALAEDEIQQNYKIDKIRFGI